MDHATSTACPAPSVSIGMPVYNGEDFVGEAIESLLSQTYSDFELIISDNASIDATSQICRAFAERDARIRYYRQPENRGAAWNYNHVFDLSRAPYFKWVAHDDLHDPTYLEHCVAALNADPGAVWCHSQSLHIDAERRPLCDVHGDVVSYVRPHNGAAANSGVDNPTRESPRASDRFRAVVLGPRGNLDIFGLMRADVLSRTSLHLPYYGQDKVLIAEISLHGRFKEIPQPLFFCRVHSGASGALPSAAEQQLWIDPQSGGRVGLLRMKLLREYFRAIRRAELPPRERLRTYGVVMRYLFQIEKWWRLAKMTSSGSGTGGGYLWHVSNSSDGKPAPKQCSNAETPGQR